MYISKIISAIVYVLVTFGFVYMGIIIIFRRETNQLKIFIFNPFDHYQENKFKTILDDI